MLADKQIYVVRNHINNKVYVGQSIDFESRWKEHLSTAYDGDKRPLYAAIRKYGADSFSIALLETCSDQEADDKERFWVTFFESFNNARGYNLTEGGRRGFTRPDLSARHISDEHKIRISEANRGRPCWLRGGHHDEATKTKIGDALRGRAKGPMSEEHRTNLSNSLKGRTAWNKDIPPGMDPQCGRKLSEETRSKMRGRKCSDATKSAMSESQKLLVDQRHQAIVALASTGMGCKDIAIQVGKDERYVARAIERARARGKL